MSWSNLEISLGDRFYNTGTTAPKMSRRQPKNDLSEDQISDFKEAFSLFDADADGNISPAELRNMMSSLGYDPSRREIEELINEANLGGTGALDFPEFVNFLGRMMKVTKEEDVLQEAFRIFDRDQTGSINSSDLYRVLESVGEKISEVEVEHMIQRADGDGNGKISYQDFAQLIKDED